MTDLKEAFDAIPWAQFGAPTPVSETARSVLSVGNYNKRLEGIGSFPLSGEGWESSLLDVQGTSIQVGRGKLLTCWHVAKELRVREGYAFAQTIIVQGNQFKRALWPITHAFNFIDPRTDAGNPKVDIGMLLCPAISRPELPYDVPRIRWGDSSALGVGTRVLIGGYPLGEEMALATKTNRGLIQPTFYDGIISAVIPAVTKTETRLLQISSVALGGISGGVVCTEDGAVVGMVTSGLMGGAGNELPVTYAIPSEVLMPWADAISFKGSDGETWR
jgi:hypothetical protein